MSVDLYEMRSSARKWLNKKHNVADGVSLCVHCASVYICVETCELD